MDKAKLIDLLYEVLPYVQEVEWRVETKEKKQARKRSGESVSLKVWQTIKTLEKWEGA